MSINAAYDADNIFAKIIRGDMPCTKLLETDLVLSFMDVFPQSDGHCLVILKNERATNLFDVDSEKLSILILAVQKLAQAVKRALEPAGIRIIQFNGASAGQTVFHLHFHIIPIYEGRELGEHASGKPANSEDLEVLAEKIRAEL